MLFFNYAFPLIFFFLLSAMLHAERGGSTISVIVTNVLVIGILGNGFFGAGIRAVQEREQNILRRFKVAPISPLPILGASLTTGLLLFIPAILLTVGLARGLYGMPIPDRPVSLIAFLAVGALAFRSIGLIVAAVSNSMAESNVLVQLLYMPMMFLSGAAIPASLLPRWTQTVAQFMPAAYLVSGMQGIITQHESLAVNWKAAAALLLTLGLVDLRRDAAVPLGERREAERLGEAVGRRRDGAVPRARRLPVPHQRADGEEPDAVAPAAARRHVPDQERAHLRRRRPRDRERIGAGAQRAYRAGLRRRRHPTPRP